MSDKIIDLACFKQSDVTFEKNRWGIFKRKKRKAVVRIFHILRLTEAALFRGKHVQGICGDAGKIEIVKTIDPEYIWLPKYRQRICYNCYQTHLDLLSPAPKSALNIPEYERSALSIKA